MTEHADVIELGPEEEARRLWRGAENAREAASGELVRLFEAIDLGLRAVEILVFEKLQPVKDQFPATIAIQMESPAPEVDPVRDAIHVPSSLEFTAIVDLLSEEELECVSPGMHRGWEDRRFACRRSRVTAGKAIGVTLGEAEREHLLLLSAYRNRIFRSPPPVRVMPAEIREAFETLRNLAKRLLQ